MKGCLTPYLLIEETCDQYARRVTEHLREVRRGTRVRNIQTGRTATAVKAVTHPYVRVTYRQREGKHKGRKIQNWWAAEHVRIAR